MSRSSAEPTAVHDPPYLTLLPDLEHELSSLALSVFQKTLALAGPTTVDIIAQSVAAVQRCVTAALAPELRIGNARLAPTRRLPEEVLCMIWQLLCVEDRVKVSHVCSSWRSLAIGTPRLWAELDFYSAVHGISCWCLFCSTISNVTFPRSWRPPSVTNLGICRNVLSRSRSLPLIGRVEFALDDTRMDDIRKVAACLEAHCLRVERLSLAMQARDDVFNFFSSLSSPFPNLRALDCTTAALWDADHRIVLPALPRAETVLIRKSMLNFKVLQLPSLLRLHCRVEDEIDVLGILNGCPKLEVLILEAGSFRTAASHTTLESISSRASRLRHVELLRVDTNTDIELEPPPEPSLLAIFQHATVRRLCVEYFGAPPARSIIFHDLDASIDLVISEGEISATDSSGRSRAVRSFVIDNAMMALFSGLSYSSVTTITLPANVWPSLQPQFPVLPCVRNATFACDEHTDFFLGEPDAEPGNMNDMDDGAKYAFGPSAGECPLPGLDHLRLVCSNDRNASDRTSVTVTVVAIIISSLKGSTPIQTLTVDDVKLEGDREQLASFVHELRI